MSLDLPIAHARAVEDTHCRRGQPDVMGDVLGAPAALAAQPDHLAAHPPRRPTASSSAPSPRCADRGGCPWFAGVG